MIIGQNVFKSIPVSERKEIFREIAKQNLQLVVRGGAGESFNVMAMALESDEMLFCHRTDNAGHVEQDQDVVVNFDHDNERYFLKSHMTSHKEGVRINSNVEIFQLQRRANVRVVLPDDFDALFSLHGHGGKKYFKDCRVKDVSAGGVRIEFSGEKPDLQIGDEVKGTLRLGTRRSMEFDLEVRFVHKRDSEKGLVYTAGTKFMNVDKTMESRLLLLMTDLQRELFVRTPQKK